MSEDAFIKKVSDRAPNNAIAGLFPKAIFAATCSGDGTMAFLKLLEAERSTGDGALFFDTFNGETEVRDEIGIT